MPFGIKPKCQTQKEKQWSVDDLTEHPEDKASDYLDPKNTDVLALILSAAKSLILIEGLVLNIKSQC